MRRFSTFLLVAFICNVINAQINFTDTKGELTVNGMGAADYKIPMALPPGIKDVAPQIAITYNSSGNNGIAGYGWNIVGVSSISRISTRIDLDGYIDGVDFDSNDQFSLDGQRLTSDGRTDNTGAYIYYTENYSNLKIRSTGSVTYPGASGSGPEKFEITFPDGTQAFYGTTSNSRGVSEWLINKWIDPQGNTIEYEYLSNNNVTYIKNIKWSKNATIGTNGYENLMEFHYKTRSRPEKAYLHGIALINNWILDRIEVKTGGELFRKYQLTHTENELKYQNLTKVQEFNGNDEPANPIVFGYDITPSINSVNIQTDWFQTDISANPFIQFSGDFDGDGRIDAVIDQKLYRNFFNTIGGSSSVTNFNLSVIVPNTIKSPINTLENGKMIQAQTLVSYSTSGGSGNDISIKENHKLFLKPNKLNTNNNLFENLYTRTVSYPYMNEHDVDSNPPYCNNSGIVRYVSSPSVKFIEGDFNGDGISEFIALGRYSIEKLVGEDDGPGPPPMQFCQVELDRYEDIPPYYIDMNPLKNDNDSSIELSYLFPFTYDDFDKIRVLDFDGNGTQDIMKIDDNGYFYIITYDSNSSYIFPVIASGQIPEYKKSNETDLLLIGDFNGDSKTDFLVPQAKNNSNWSLYFSKGNGLEKTNVNLEEYVKTFQGDIHAYSYHYYTIDINGDGKSDIVRVKLETHKKSWTINDTDSYYEVKAFTNLVNNGLIEFPQTYLYNSGNSERPHPGTPIVGNFKSPSANYELLIMKDECIPGPGCVNHTQLVKFDFKKNQSQDMSLIEVNEVNGNILTEIIYNKLEPNANNGDLGDVNGNYFSSNQEIYPFVEIKQLPNSNIVTKLKVTSMGQSKERDFKYFGLTSHSHGWGILGFKIMAQSSWYTSGINSKIWQVNHSAPSLRGAPIGNWSFSGNNLNLITNPIDNQLLSKNTYWYINQSLSQNRYVTIPYQQVENDFLTGVTTTTNSEYDSYWNLKKSIVQRGGTYTTDFTYANNPNGVGANYYVGRLTRKNYTSNAYGDIRTSEEKFTFSGNQIIKKESKGHNTDYITENFQYDGYGNVTQITTTAPGVASRTILNEYESSGRFVKKKTDIDGFITNLTYNNLGQVSTHTNHLNQTITSSYDKWGKLLQTIQSGVSVAPIITNYAYNRQTNGNWDVSSNSFETKSYEKNYFDVLGRQVKNRIKGFANNTYISTSTEYDFLGRVKRVSEPYFDNSENSNPTQWNSTTYDYLSRPINQTAFTGKTTTISYNGLSATTSENGKTKTITKDAIGNVISVNDNGQTLTYNYYADNSLKSTSYGNHTVSIGIDGWGRKISLLDPSISTIPYTYQFNNFGEILEETTPNGTTTYFYSLTGRLLNKEIFGDNTNISVQYDYNTKGLLVSEIGNLDGTPHSILYDYDTLNRIKSKIEFHGLPSVLTTSISKSYVYDDYSRLSEESTSTIIKKPAYHDLVSNLTIKNIYNNYNGILDHITDKTTNATVWKLTAANHRLQTTAAQLGNGVNISNTYNTYGYITSINHTKTGLTAPLSLNYSFNHLNGTLTNRKNNYYNYTENFTYDNIDRLVSWTTPNGIESNSYESDGRIKTNTNIGTYNYNNTSRYKKRNISLNSTGQSYYSNRTLQQVTYNAFKKPVLISETGRGSIDFQYGLSGSRIQSIEWVTEMPNTGNNNLKRTKLFGSDGTVEIIIKGGHMGFGMNESYAKIINYVGGTAYSAPAIYVSDYQNPTTKTDKYLYLHRDFQGSILAISDANSIIERRHFDAWGNVSRFNNATNPNLTGGEFYFDRGYTGHEHFFRVGIIHMNGRIYDPVLKGFMSPDNFVQDPHNSQSLNRYAYCLNNPLMYTDPSGEAWEIGVGGAIAIGAAIAAASYTLVALTTWTEFSVLGLLKSSVIGGVSGFVSFGVGSLANSIFVNSVCTPITTATNTQVAVSAVGKAAFQMVGHAVSQAYVAGLSGGDAGQAFLSGLVSSVVSTGVMGINSSLQLNGTAGDVSTILFGSVSGGLSSELTGGNFWQGAAIGLTVSGLNHVAHKIEQRNLVNERLKNIGLNGRDKPTVSTSEIDYLTNYDPTLNSMLENANNPEIGIDRNLKVAGTTKGDYNNNTVKSMNLGLKAFKNYYSLYQTIAHELFHGIQFISGTYGAAVQKFGYKYAKPLMEAQALYFNWELDPGNMFWFNKANSEMIDHLNYYAK